jgi:hypothetical protein
MGSARGSRLACLALGLALLGSACSWLREDAGQDGVRGGTLRVLTADVIERLDTAITYSCRRIWWPSPAAPAGSRAPRGRSRSSQSLRTVDSTSST